MKQEKGYSLPQILIAVVISTILSSIVSTKLWPVVDEARVKTLSKYIINITSKASALRYKSFTDLKDSNLDGDYLDDAIISNIIAPVPESLFDSYEDLSIKIHRVVVNEYPVFYLRIKTNNDKDENLITKSISETGVKNYVND